MEGVPSSRGYKGGFSSKLMVSKRMRWCRGGRAGAGVESEKGPMLPADGELLCKSSMCTASLFTYALNCTLSCPSLPCTAGQGLELGAEGGGAQRRCGTDGGGGTQVSGRGGAGRGGAVSKARVRGPCTRLEEGGAGLCAPVCLLLHGQALLSSEAPSSTLSAEQPP